MYLLLVLLLSVPLVMPSQNKTQRLKTKCVDLFEVVATPSSSLSQKIRIKRSGVTPDNLHSCIGRDDLRGSEIGNIASENSFEKDQYLKIPKVLFTPFSSWMFEYRYLNGRSFSSGPKGNAHLSGQNVFIRYTKTFKRKYDAIFWLGLNQLKTQGKIQSINYEESSQVIPVGQVRLKFNYNLVWSYYVFSRIERYSTTIRTPSGEVKQAFSLKTDAGVGIEKSWGNRWVSRIDSSLVYPSINRTNSINSGLEVGVELEYQWRNWIANYRLGYLETNNQVGHLSNQNQVFSFAYRF